MLELVLAGVVLVVVIAGLVRFGAGWMRRRGSGPNDPGHESRVREQIASRLGTTEYRERLRRRILGDPRQAPSRIIRALIFLFVLGVVAAALLVLGSSADDVGGTGSYWLFDTISTLIEHPLVILGAAIFLYFRLFGLRRSWAASLAADRTGWLVETVKQLSDEVRSMAGSSLVVVSSGDSRSDIQAAVSDALDASITGDSHARDRPSFYSTVDDVVDDDLTVGAAAQAEARRDDITTAVENASSLATELAWQTEYDPLSSRAAERHMVRESQTLGIGREIDPDELRSDPPSIDDDTTEDNADVDSEDDPVPWSVALREELHSLWLSFSASMSKGRIYLELGLPYVIATWVQLTLMGFWVRPEVYLLVLFGTSPLIALGTFWARSRIQDRRIQRHRTPETGSFWTDAAARVKIVDTPDVTAYVGQTAGGRTYASYNRSEFVTEFSQRLWEMTREDESVSPSVLEQYARNLEQMKPNLYGHLDNIELPAIRSDIADAVNNSQDEVISKAGLAWQVIPRSSRGYVGSDLGHDPKLVAEVYRQKVEEIHSLAEIETTRTTPDGTEVSLTLVYPTTKTRLPDMTELHSRFSERFAGIVGDPLYELPEVDPREDLEGHAVPYATQTTIKSAGELPAPS